MTLLNRLDVREAIADLLRARLVPTYAVAVHAEPPADFGGKSPLVVVTSGGTDRTGEGRMTFGGSIAPSMLFNLVTMALATGNADTNLDTLEHQIAIWVDLTQRGAHWTAVSYAGRSETTDVTTIKDGKQYRIETIPLLFTGIP